MAKRREFSDFVQAALIDHQSGLAYFLHLLIQMRRIPTTAINTMAVSVDSSGLKIYFNPEFVSTLTYKNFLYVLKHEILHITNLHHLREDKTVSHELNNIAMDLAVNSILGATDAPESILIPGKGLFRDFPPNLSMEAYLEMLKKNSIEISGMSIFDGFDGHNVRRKEGESMAPEQKDATGEIVKQAIKKAAEYAKAIGDIPGWLEEIINAIISRKIDWRKYLRNWLGEKIYVGIKTSKKMRNKRYRQFHGIIPGFKKEYIDPILIAIDTSGSMSNKELSMFLGEISNIQYPKRIIQCDTVITQDSIINERKLRQLKMVGRGGTDFRPIFEYAKKIKSKSIIIFTDLMGDFPETKPNIKTLWITNNDKDKPPFGDVVVI